MEILLEMFLELTCNVKKIAIKIAKKIFGDF
jgi:hypothetical protein